MSKLSTPIFLLGTQRSGTTLLTRILSSHSSLYIQNEMNKSGIFAPPLSRQKLDVNITSKLKSVYGIDAYKLTIEGIQWGWKDPLLTEHLDVLFQFYSDSKYILIIRDPRAVTLSYIDNAWGLGTNVYTGAQRWVDEVSKQLAFAQKLKDNCLVLKYEDLILSTELILKKICLFLGVEYDENMLDFYKTPLEFKENKSNTNTKRPINSVSMEKWQKQLSEEQLGVINVVAGNLMAELGYNQYSDTKTHLNSAQKFYYTTHQKIIGEIQLQYQLRKANKKSLIGKMLRLIG